MADSSAAPEGQHDAGRRPPRARRVVARIVLALASGLLTYGVAEAIATALYLRGSIAPESLWFHELPESGRSIRFDAVRGYWLAPNPSRMACIATDGTVESVGVFSGNNEGFPDQDAFQPRKEDRATKRFLVLGDSFSAGLFLTRNWPEAAEDLSREAEPHLDLMNCSIDGGGLANWWSVLTRFIGPRGYELDGVIYAALPNDLWRGFVFWDDGAGVSQPDRSSPGRVQTVRMGRLPLSCHPDGWPSSLAQARPYLRPVGRWGLVPASELDPMLEGRRIEHRRGFELFLTNRLLRTVSVKLGMQRPPWMVRIMAESPPVDDVGKFDPAIRWYLEEMRRFLRARDMPVLVVEMPQRDLLLHDYGPLSATRTFAAAMGATLVDGADAFRGLSAREIRAHWLPYDPHWAQSGSDRFAAFMVETLRNWPRRSE